MKKPSSETKTRGILCQPSKLGREEKVAKQIPSCDRFQNIDYSPVEKSCTGKRRNHNNSSLVESFPEKRKYRLVLAQQSSLEYRNRPSCEKWVKGWTKLDWLLANVYLVYHTCMTYDDGDFYALRSRMHTAVGVRTEYWLWPGT